MMRKRSLSHTALFFCVAIGAACADDQRTPESSAGLHLAADTGTIVSGGFGLYNAEGELIGD